MCVWGVGVGRARLSREAVAGGDKKNSNICRQAEGKETQKGSRRRRENPKTEWRGDQPFQMHQRGQVREAEGWERGPGLWQVLGERRGAASVEKCELGGKEAWGWGHQGVTGQEAARKIGGLSSLFPGKGEDASGRERLSAQGRVAHGCHRVYDEAEEHKPRGDVCAQQRGSEEPVCGELWTECARCLGFSRRLSSSTTLVILQAV